MMTISSVYSYSWPIFAGHKGHWLGIGMILLGLGAFICTLPQFTTGPYRAESQQKDTCQLGIASWCGMSFSLDLRECVFFRYLNIFLLN